MIRKALRIAHVTLIVALTSGAAGAGLLWLLSVISWPGLWQSKDAVCGFTVIHHVRPVVCWEASRGGLPMPEAVLLTAGQVVVMHYGAATKGYRPGRKREADVGPIRIARHDGPRGIAMTKVEVSLWLPALVLMIYPMTVFVLRGPLRRRRRRKRGLCVACGYNLRGLHEPRCPECGREFTS